MRKYIVGLLASLVLASPAVAGTYTSLPFTATGGTFEGCGTHCGLVEITLLLQGAQFGPPAVVGCAGYPEPELDRFVFWRTVDVGDGFITVELGDAMQGRTQTYCVKAVVTAIDPVVAPPAPVGPPPVIAPPAPQPPAPTVCPPGTVKWLCDIWFPQQ